MPLRADLLAGRTTPARAVQDCLQAIEANRGLNLFVGLDPQGARAHAAAPVAGAWSGVPVGVKDNLWVAEWPITAGSRLLDGFVAPADATAVARLRQAGAVFVGRTNMDEFGMGGATELGRDGPAENPVAPGRVTGGSSGGSAGAVAAGLVPLALGSDTGGSIRQPAAFCSVVGLKPTWGRVSRFGLIAFASSLDTVGPLARTVGDAADALQVMAGVDPLDATTAARPVDDLRAATEAGVSGLRVGYPRPAVAVDDEIAAAVDRAAATLAAAGATVVNVSLPHAPHALSAYVIIAAAEASSNLARFDGVRYGRRATNPVDLDDLVTRSRGEGFGPEVQRRLIAGTFALSEGGGTAFFDQATRVRTLIIEDYHNAFAACDLLLTPTTPELPFARGTRTSDPLALYRADALTVGPSLAGLPAISVPAGRSQSDLPMGVQLVGPWWSEARLVAAASVLEASMG